MDTERFYAIMNQADLDPMPSIIRDGKPPMDKVLGFVFAETAGDAIYAFKAQDGFGRFIEDELYNIEMVAIPVTEILLNLEELE